MKEKSTQQHEYKKMSVLSGIFQSFQKLTLLLCTTVLAFQLQAAPLAQNVKGKVTDESGAPAENHE